MIFSSQAIVFRSVDYSESSRIVTLFTQRHGKIGVMVRGAKKPKNKFSGLLEVGKLLDIVYYYKSTRSVQYLKEASFAEQTPSARNRFEKLALITPAIELIGQLLHDGEINEELFTFTWRLIKWTNEVEETPPAVFPYIQIRLTELMGLSLQVADQSEGDLYINVEEGSISPTSNTKYSYKLTEGQKNFVLAALQSQSRAVLHIAMDRAELKELIRYLDAYLKYHLEGIRDRKSDAIFEQML